MDKQVCRDWFVCSIVKVGKLINFSFRRVVFDTGKPGVRHRIWASVTKKPGILKISRGGQYFAKVEESGKEVRFLSGVLAARWEVGERFYFYKRLKDTVVGKENKAARRGLLKIFAFCLVRCIFAV
ncbi:hypothetical protein [Parapedobacter pyrenivorans]|uniref:hypothetical protein n=1 Tax=Parapedobacter pyrenivorans TaxID=1305674 RepID=UPI0016645CA0|nr:hypothetical protein [Parapedobacter pyrenivorans]